MRHHPRRPAADRWLLHPVEAVLDRCERRQAAVCVLRDADRITDPAGGEVDLLLDRRHLDGARAAFRDEGFVELSAWGHAPHHFFVRYDAAFDRWIKCDVVTDLVYGGPRRSRCTALAGKCLSGRRREGGVPVLSPEDELFTLLLHELLDKQTFRPHRIARLEQLRCRVTQPDRIARHLQTYWPAVTWAQLAGIIDRGEWAALLARRGELQRSVRQASGSQPLDRGRAAAARLAGRLAGLVRPQAPSVSFLAPDGAGKSTLIAGLAEHFFGPACPIYMGLHQKHAPAPARRLPGIGLLAALAGQWRRCLRARYQQAGGRLVLFDRYSYDAWLPSRRRRGRWSALRRAILARACPAPDLSIVLDVPADVLFARKPEHPPALLEEQRECYRGLQRRVPRVVIVDAARPFADVRRTVMSLVWERYRFGRRAPTTVAVGKA
jgi:hypothetical protein